MGRTRRNSMFSFPVPIYRLLESAGTIQYTTVAFAALRRLLGRTNGTAPDTHSATVFSCSRLPVSVPVYIRASHP